MPFDISSIPAEDRQDFERRLQTYGIDSSNVQEPLTVSPSGRVNLAYGPNRESARSPIVVRTRDFAAVKRMVGIEDGVFRNVASRVTLPGPVSVGRRVTPSGFSVMRDADPKSFEAAPGLELDDPQAAANRLSDEDLRSLDYDAVNNIRLAAKAFVRGDSRLVSSFRPVIERVIGEVIIPVWPLVSVTVPSGSVLEFGSGVNVLLAYEVIIEEGGIIRSQGHLTVNCTKVRRPGQSVRPVLTNRTGTFRPVFSG